MNNISSNESALGLVETRGLIGALEAADAMVKAAKVKLHATELSTGAMVVVKVTGEVGAVRSAVDAGAAAAQRVGHLISTHIIPRPHDETENMVFPGTTPPGDDNPIDFSQMTVRELRTFARNMTNFKLTGREISSANRETLLNALQSAQDDAFICRFPSAKD